MGGPDLEEIQRSEESRLNPLRLPAVESATRLVVGDRRPGYRHCACCGGFLDGGLVRRGIWAYCSIECALRAENGDRR